MARVRSRRLAVTLLEIMIVISLMMMVSSLIGWNVYSMVLKQRVATQVQQFKTRLIACRHLAMNMQADWKGVFENGVFFVYCVEDPKAAAAPPLQLQALELMVNGRNEPKIVFNFASSGDVSPHGQIEIHGKDGAIVRWILPTFEEKL
jgi:type II secretory pathway pseudopilin PulG